MVPEEKVATPTETQAQSQSLDFSFKSLATNPGSVLSVAALISAFFYVCGWLTRSILLGRYGLDVLQTSKESALASGVVFILYCAPAVYFIATDAPFRSKLPAWKRLLMTCWQVFFQVALTYLYAFLILSHFVQDNMQMSLQETGYYAGYVGFMITSNAILQKSLWKGQSGASFMVLGLILGLFYTFSTVFAYRLKPEWGGLALRSVRYRLNNEPSMRSGHLITGDDNYVAISDAPSATAFVKLQKYGPTQYKLHVYRKESITELQMELLDK